MNARDKHNNVFHRTKDWSGVLGHAFSASNKTETSKFKGNYDALLRSIVRATTNAGSLDKAEPEVRAAFKSFLKAQQYEFALRNFEKLLEEKSGNSFKRSNGSVNWYHEFIPVLAMMGMVRQGLLTLEAMNQYGGLETAIASHLRHDSVEDIFKGNHRLLNKQLHEMLEDIKKSVPGYDMAKGETLVRQTGINVRLVTQRYINDPSTGAKTKEDTIAYTQRILYSENANPIAFLSKQGDGVHNFATMWAPKFSAERRNRRCDEREDMYGPRHGFSDTAMEKWPQFSKAIKAMDDMMGVMLYTHFRYLESVDLHYKKPSDNVVGIRRFIHGAMALKLPKQINLIHIFMDNLTHSVAQAEEPAKFDRLQHFIQVNMRPAFKGYMQHFGHIFKKTDHVAQPPAPAPVA